MNEPQRIHTGRLAASPRVLVPAERYAHIVRVFYRTNRAWMIRGPIHDARITETLAALEPLAGADDEGRAIRYAYKEPQVFIRWARRHPALIARILAEAAGRPLGSTTVPAGTDP